MLWWEVLLLGASAVVVLLVIVYSHRAGIPPVPSGLRVKAAILSLLDVDEQGTVVDLGSGWGSLVFPIARRCPQASVIGYELSPVPWLVSKLRAWAMKTRNLRMQRCDFFDVSLQDVDVVVCYLYTGAMKRLADKLKHELKPGARVITHTFSIPGWRAVQTIQLKDLFRTPIYVYQVPSSLPSKDTFEVESKKL